MIPRFELHKQLKIQIHCKAHCAAHNHSIKLENLQNGKQTQQAQAQNQTSKSRLNTKIANPMAVGTIIAQSQKLIETPTQTSIEVMLI